jgi:hypothetical protein
MRCSGLTVMAGRIVAPLGLIVLATSAWANLVTDWDAAGVSVASPGALGEREMAVVHVAIFDAINSIERRYRPFLFQVSTAQTTSREAAAASAAASVLAELHPDKAADVKARLAGELGKIPDTEAKTDGVRLGEEVARMVLQARANDGAKAPDAYRPKTAPGVYVATANMVGSAFADMTPFVLTSPSQFRPPPPVSLQSPEWARDYNEIKSMGNKNSSERSARQTETARFWLMVGPPAYHPIARQVVAARQLSLIDSARFMSLYAAALTDAYIAVFDAKYHYEFWRPVTAIRNGDMGGNPDTLRDATWQPIDNTPMHPEYPCAHCIQVGAAVSVIESLVGSDTILEVSLTSSTAPGVTHRWTSLQALADEVAEARICAGFHYRFSTRVGTEMGRKIGQYIVQHAVQPAASTESR